MCDLKYYCGKVNVREHKHRLARKLYKGKIACVFTACIANKIKIFLSDRLFDSMERILLDCLKKERCESHVYIFMPDHCHFLVEGKSGDSDLWQFMVSFRQRSGYWLSQNQIPARWQKDFYDHILRKDEDLPRQIRYILENPLRKVIVNNCKEYPYKGSTIYDFDDWINF